MDVSGGVGEGVEGADGAPSRPPPFSIAENGGGERMVWKMGASTPGANEFATTRARSRPVAAGDVGFRAGYYKKV